MSRRPLRAVLAALYGQAALTARSGEPSERETTRALAQSVGQKLSPGKRALLLRTTLAGYDARAAGQRLTPEQAAHLLGTSASEPPPPTDGLTIEQLDLLTAETWQSCVTWLLEDDGCGIDQITVGPSGVLWRGQRGERRILATAIRLPRGWTLGAEEVQHLAALGAGEPGTHAILVSTAPASIAAQVTAKRLRVQLLDRSVLAERLAHLTITRQVEQAQARSERDDRAREASAVRAQVVEALLTCEAVLTGATSGRRAESRMAVSLAAATVNDVRGVIERALAEWERLVEGWSAGFGERPARDGSLPMPLDPATLRHTREHAVHLREALRGALNQLMATPSDGAHTYGQWRAAVVDYAAARCRALRHRVEGIEPAHWQDFAAAYSEETMQQSAAARTAAAEAAAREARHYGTLARQMGLPPRA